MKGSSPLTRGKRQVVSFHFGREGLIPAHAGKTGGGPVEWDGGGAHPRSRGENTRYWCVTSRRGGSSPLTRGKQPRQQHGETRTGLIPAHAGKTRSRPWVRGTPWAHPRSRGENPRPCRPVRIRQGSSPLTRGKRQLQVHGNAPVGLIPAHAGKTRGRRSRTCPARAHPRSRGENHPDDGADGGGLGSSPLTRGKPWWRTAAPR